MTENQAATSEDFSPGELAYLESRGTNSEALESELSALLGKGGPSAAQDADQVAQEKPPEAAAGPSADQVAQVGKPAAQGDSASSGPSGPSAAQVEKPGFVPVNALHEERRARKELEAQLAQFQERFSRADERQKLLNELLGNDPTKQAKPQELIDPEKDIFGAFKQLQERYGELQGKTAEVNSRVAQQTEEQQLRQAYHTDATRFMQATPDFPGAYNHLMNVRDQELSALGIANPQERQAIMVREEQQIAKSAITGGRSAAETIYNLAKLRGFSPEQAKIVAETPPASNVSDAAKQLEAVQKGREAAMSLSNAGTSSSAELTAQSLADMSDDDFERAFSKMSESQRRKLMGG